MPDAYSSSVGPLAALGLGAVTTVAGVIAVIALAVLWPGFRRLIFFLIYLVPALVLWVVGVFALPLWRITNALVSRILAVLPLDALAERGLARVGMASSNPLLRGDRHQVAKALWPEKTYPDLYRAIPDDIRRPPYEDGRLSNGVRLTWLADRYVTAAAVRSAVRISTTAAILAFIVLAVLFLLSAFSGWFDVLNQLMGGQKLILEQWPGADPVAPPTSWWIAAGWSVVAPALLHMFGKIITVIPAFAIACVGFGVLMTFLVLRGWFKQKAAPYEWQSKDADVRWAFRAESRKLTRVTYSHQIKQATEHLKDAALYTIGVATGTLRVRGDLSAPTDGQWVKIDQEAMFQHMLVFGGIGEGKTTAVLKPMIRQLLADKMAGMFVCDAKGVLWEDVRLMARAADREADVNVIGTGKGQCGVDILAELTPTQVAATLRSVLAQLSGGTTKDSFWPDMAANVLRNVLSIGRAFGVTEAGQTQRTISAAPYSLWWAYQAILREEVLDEAIEAVRSASAQLLEDIKAAETKEALQAIKGSALYQVVMTDETRDSVAYLDSAWRTMAKETKSGILANITQLLDGFAGVETLRERFACGAKGKLTTIGAALNGKIVLNALSSIEDGLPARVISVLLKTNLYREARRREAFYRQTPGLGKPQDKPCYVIMDEVQEIVTADPASGLSDATFWNVARSTGVAGVFATQTVAALTQAIGPAAAANFMQQSRSKIFFRTEDRETVDFACWCAGQFERNRVYDDNNRESIEYRGLIDGWNPLDPVDDQEQIAGGPRLFFAAGMALLNPQLFAVGTAQRRRAYDADTRFMPTAGEPQALHIAQMSSLQAAAWRAEDLERDYRKTGNEQMSALTPSDIIHLGRWQAFAHIQRAGAVRQDIIAVAHDFS